MLCKIKYDLKTFASKKTFLKFYPRVWSYEHASFEFFLDQQAMKRNVINPPLGRNSASLLWARRAQLCHSLNSCWPPFTVKQGATLLIPGDFQRNEETDVSIVVQRFAVKPGRLHATCKSFLFISLIPLRQMFHRSVESFEFFSFFQS